MLHAEPPYGRSALTGLRPYGVAVRVVCTGDLRHREDEFAEHIRRRLEARAVRVVQDGSVTLKLFLTSVASGGGTVAAHLRMELDQAAFLGLDNRIVDAPTWDAWKMGEYREEELMGEVDDLARQFLNDYVATN